MISEPLADWQIGQDLYAVAAEQFGRANAGVLQNGGRIIDARCDDHPVSCG